MLAALPVIMRVIIQILQILGIGWVAYKLERAGAVDATARAVKQTAAAGGTVAGTIGALGDSSPMVFLALAAVFILLVSQRR